MLPRSERTGRDSSFELFRLFCLLLILFHHWSMYSDLPIDTTEISFSRFFGEFMRFGGKIACNGFVLVSGYFLVNARFSTSKLLRLWLETAFYSVGLYVFAVIAKRIEFSGTDLLQYCFPLTTNKYWFIRAYCLLYLLMPALNAMIRGLSKGGLLLTILALFVPLCVVGTFTFLPKFTKENPWFSSELWFIDLYLIAAYVRLYPNAFTERKGLPFLLGFATVVLIWISYVVMDRICAEYNEGREWSQYIYAYTFSGEATLPGFFCAFFFFLGFKNLKLGCIPPINLCASSVFGIYLLHAHPVWIKELWTNLFKTSAYYGTPWFALFTLLCVLGLFGLCFAVDWLRKTVLERPLFYFLDPPLRRMDDAIRRKLRLDGEKN